MKNPSILVTGGNGQLGSEFRVLAASCADYHFTFIDINDLDLTDESAVNDFFQKRHFDFLINCSAYTAVDKAESEQLLAQKVNAFAVKTLSGVCSAKGIRLLHISTDYVFDGSANLPIAEDTMPNPISVYGKTKLEGERYALELAPNSYVIRTAWVYSTFGKNFVKTIINLARERSELGIVADQVGSPTYARDLANCIMTMIQGILHGNDEPGIYHYSNEGIISWYDFAYFITKSLTLPCKIIPIKTQDYKTLAVRPAFSVLDKSKIKKTFKLQIPHWSESLTDCLNKMNA